MMKPHCCIYDALTAPGEQFEVLRDADANLQRRGSCQEAGDAIAEGRQARDGG